MGWRLFSKYLAIRNIAENVAESSGLGTESETEGFWTKVPSNSSISLSIEERAQNVGVTTGVIEVWFLQKCLQP